MKGGIEGRNRTVVAVGREGSKEMSGEDDRQQPDHGKRGSVLSHLIYNRTGVCLFVCLFLKFVLKVCWERNNARQIFF